MRQDIRNVNDMESLVAYFSENLGWDIDLDDFYDIDDITYDFDASDLGLKEEAFAKINSLKQLRPLVDNQKWGIFFVNFSGNRFEVSALRKILSGLIPTRRNSVDHAVWDKSDLLFLCTWGKTNSITIGAAHFEDSDKGLPQIKMISCEPAVEDFTQIRVFEERLSKLSWPENPNDVIAWKDQWSSAFVTRYRQTIQDSHTLTVRLAEEAKDIRDHILEILQVETSNGYVHQLYEKFKNTLVHDMTSTQFADMYAQTVVYGLFSARCMDSTQEDFSAEEAIDCIPHTNPFLRSLMQECFGANTANSRLSFDELDIGDIVDLLRHTETESIIQDFNRQTGSGREDPVIHFYEEFLTEYDKTQKVQRGVYYTPQPVVNFIVRAVDEILKSEFAIEDGLASTITKKIKVKRSSKRKIDGLYRIVESEAEVPAIQILDPATGTGTFIRQTILHIYHNFKEKYNGRSEEDIQREWNEYVPNHLLPRLNGFELMMAPYAVAHMKLAMVLKDTGYNFSSDKRLQVFLTNSLEEAGSDDYQMTIFSDPLALESIAANSVKKNVGINIVIGNPPYSISSSNKGDWILNLIADYKHGLNERKINLDDDYIKFVRLAQYIVHQAGTGIIAFITNNSFLDGITHREMRHILLQEFDKIYIINLHGNSKRFEKAPDGTKDENVFDIQQGVSINIFIKKENHKNEPAIVYYSDIFGLREKKYSILNSTRSISDLVYEISPVEPYYFFIPMDFSEKAKYEEGFAVDELMHVNSSGIQTKNDRLAIGFSKEAVEKVQDDFKKLASNELIEKYSLKDSAGWKVRNAIDDIKNNFSSVEKILYRPFDWRYVLYTNKSSGFLGRPREKVSCHFVGYNNLGLLVRRNTPPVDFTHVYVTDSLISEGVLGIDPNGREYVFPLYLYNNLTSQPVVNMDPGILKKIAKQISQASVNPVDVFSYVYAVLHCECQSLF